MWYRRSKLIEEIADLRREVRSLQSKINPSKWTQELLMSYGVKQKHVKRFWLESNVSKREFTNRVGVLIDYERWKDGR